MIIFTNPRFLFLLLMIPLFVFFHIISMRGIRRRAIKFANFDAVSRISGVEVFSKNITLLYINVIIFTLVVFSISGFSIIKPVQTSSFSFIIALDNSGTMGSTDIEPTRLEAAKTTAIDFLKTVPESTRIGVVAFSASPIIMQEISTDKIAIGDSIKSIKLGGFSGTDMLSAVAASAGMLKNEKNKAVILISDGEANLNTVQQLIDLSKNNNLIVNTLSIRPENSTNKGESLRLISDNTGGVFYSIKKSDDFYNSINDLNQSIKKDAITDLSRYLLISALILFIINFALSNTRYRGLP